MIQRSPYRGAERGEISCHHKMKLVRGVVGGGGESGNVFAVTKLFSDDPKVPAWKESSVVLWCEQREGGRGQNGRSLCITKGHRSGWVGLSSQSLALNPPQEERAALENSTNPVYQVSSQHSGRHPDLRVNERRERFWARRQQSGTKLLDKPTFPNENL